MLDQKILLSFSKKITLPLFLSFAFAYGDIQPISLEPVLETEQSAISQFLNKNLYVTVLTFDRPIGTFDLFMMNEKHHRWAQMSLLPGRNTLGVGAGYRYLIKGHYPSNDWFWGVYGYARYNPWKNKAYYHRLNWNAGVEVATARFQYIINGYGMRPWSLDDEKRSLEYREGDLGISLRFSWYILQKMRTFGRINPFFVSSWTQFNHADKEGKDILKRKYGIGAKWELPQYVSVEFKYVWDRFDNTKGGLYGGIQLEPLGRKNKDANYAAHRVHEMPQYYEPCYGDTEPKSESDASEKEGAGESSAVE